MRSRCVRGHLRERTEPAELGQMVADGRLVACQLRELNEVAAGASAWQWSKPVTSVGGIVTRGAGLDPSSRPERRR